MPGHLLEAQGLASATPSSVIGGVAVASLTGSESTRKLLHIQKASDACGGEGMALQIFISHTGGRHYADPNALPSYVLFTLLILLDTC